MMNQQMKIFFVTCLGFAVRLVSVKYTKDVFANRVEVSTPINDWKRAKEAIFLQEQGYNPYLGNIFHEYPFSLYLYKAILTYLNIEYVVSSVDVITALFLMLSCRRQLLLEGKEERKAQSIAMNVYLIYLFSPLGLIACASLSTTTFTNLFLSLILLIQPIRWLKPLTCIVSALLTCNNIHYGALTLPVFLCIEYSSNRKQIMSNQQQATHIYYRAKNFLSSIYTSIATYATSMIVLLLGSYMITGHSWQFMRSVYLFALRIEDLKPNIGMLWYFFTEMFEQFLDFFVWVVQINAFIHVIPTSIYLRDKPFFLLYMTTLSATIFQPYPSISNINLIVSLLPRWSDQTTYLKHGLTVTCAFITCMSLWPIFWHLWIVLGTANSNFYFGATLAFTSSMIVLMIDLFNSHGYMNAKFKLDEYKKRHKLLAD